MMTEKQTTNPSIASRLHSIGMRLSEEAFDGMVKGLHQRRASPTQTLEVFAVEEGKERARRNLHRRERAAAIGVFKPITEFDWKLPKLINRELVKNVLELDFLTRRENVLFRGQSGVGKTMLAQNVAQRAIQLGHTVRFVTVAQALTHLGKQDGYREFDRAMAKYTKPDLLILDELGYIPLGLKGADYLFNIIAARHEKRSTIITTNRPFKEWPEIFENAASVHACVDRFCHHCVTVDIDGPTGRDPKKKRT